MVVKVHHAYQLLQGPYGNHPWKIQNRLYLGREGHSPLICEAMAQKVNGCHIELALCRVNIQPLLDEMLEQGSKVGEVLIQQALATKMSSRVHETLKGLGHVLNAKGHAQELKMSKRSDDCHLGDIRRVHGNLVVPPQKVHLRKNNLAGQVH